jgi:SsrA-binding protein
MKKEVNKGISVQNRKASFEYHFLETFEAGIVLLGTEIKSIRQGGTNISDAYCYCSNNEVFIKNMHISPLKNAGENQHDPLRIRKLLLTKKEIRKIIENLKNQGLTVIPVSLFTNKRGLVKIKVAIAKGKKLYDKRDSIKKKDIERDLKREEV